MTQLLISVQSLCEAAALWTMGVDIVDFKDPVAGPLAAVSADVWAAAVTCRPVRTDGPSPSPGVALSAALGEADSAAAVAAAVPREFAFAKMGVSGLASVGSLRQAWRSVADRLPGTVQSVAVAYADHQAAGCLSPEAILDEAAAAGFGRLLIDTFSKDGTSTVTHLGEPRLARIIAAAHAAGLWIAIAGGIRLEQAAGLTGRTFTPGQGSVGPDCWAVRGDVCRGDRTGHLDIDRVDQWVRFRDLTADTANT